MPKKAVAIFFLAAFIGAAIFVYFTFPRTKDEMPKSNNQRPYPSSHPTEQRARAGAGNGAASQHAQRSARPYFARHGLGHGG